MRLIYKLLTALLLVLALMAGALVAAVHWTFDPQLSRYLHRLEIDQVTPLTQLLAQVYTEDGGWHRLRGDHRRWHALVSTALEGAAPAVGPPSHEVVDMMPRLTVFAADGEPVVRSPLPLRTDRPPNWTELPITVEGTRVGTLRMVPTPIPAKGLNEQFRADQLRALYLAAIPALLLTLLAALPLGWHFVAPLRQLTGALHQLAGGRYAVRLPTRRRDEFGQVAADVNRLAEVLERTDALRREGMASVSHELRNPLATMITEVEAMRDGIRPLNEEQLSALSGSMEHLSTLVDDLYQLALADVKALVCHKEPLAWDSVVNEGVAAAQARLTARRLTVTTDIEADTVVDGDAKRLRQVIDNLLENCCRYTASGGAVTVSLRWRKGEAELTVADDGPGVADADLAALFDRFYRADPSRSRETGGAGLGLALVRAIAEAHGGRVHAFHSASGGLGITVAIPV